MAGTRSPQGEANQTGSPVPGALAVVVDAGDGMPAVVRVTGEVDMLTAPALAEQVRPLFGADADAGESSQETGREAGAAVSADGSPAGHAVILDLTGVGFLGSAGLAVLAEAATLAARRSVPLRVVADAHAVLRPLQVAGLDTVLTIVGDLDTAVRQCAG